MHRPRSRSVSEMEFRSLNMDGRISTILWLCVCFFDLERKGMGGFVVSTFSFFLVEGEGGWLHCLLGWGGGLDE